MTTTTLKNDANRYGLRAPKGGCTVDGKVYKGGQFCKPYDVANPHGVEPLVVVVVEAPVIEAPTPVAVPKPIRVGITGFAYDVRQIPAGECGTIAYRMDKFDEGRTYDVIRNFFDEVTCDCPDYVARHEGNGTMCKHGRKLVEIGLIPAPTPKRTEPTTTRPTTIPARTRRFYPSAEDCRLAAEMFSGPGR